MQVSDVALCHQSSEKERADLSGRSGLVILFSSAQSAADHALF